VLTNDTIARLALATGGSAVSLLDAVKSKSSAPSPSVPVVRHVARAQTLQSIYVHHATSGTNCNPNSDGTSTPTNAARPNPESLSIFGELMCNSTDLLPLFLIAPGMLSGSNFADNTGSATLTNLEMALERGTAIII
jgi:hypothetical protein